MFCTLCIPLIHIVMGICALYVFLQVVKRFEFPKALYKFPIIIIIELFALGARKQSYLCTKRSLELMRQLAKQKI